MTAKRQRPSRAKAEPSDRYDIEPLRILQKVQQDPTGALLIQNAQYACVVEDQQEVIRQLQSELVAKSKSGSGQDEDSGVAEETT